MHVWNDFPGDDDLNSLSFLWIKIRDSLQNILRI